MALNLSIKNAPDDIVRRLKARAKKHHRSLQGEMLAILEEAVRAPGAVSPRDVLDEVARRRRIEAISRRYSARLAAAPATADAIVGYDERGLPA